MVSTRICVCGLFALLLAGCMGGPTSGLLRGELGRSVAHATLVAGSPDHAYDLPDGRRAFVFRLPVLVPTAPQRCPYTLYAEQVRGERNSLAAWRVVEVVPPAAGCEPVRRRV
jgi:hypothetical protein